MIHYRDRAFCSESHRCGNRACYRNLAPDTDTRGLPVSYSNFKTPDCGYQPLTTDASTKGR